METLNLNTQPFIEKVKPKIMLVEDNKSLNDLLMFKLTEKGYTVNQIFDGLVAGPLIMNLNPDLVLLDMKLPGKSGQEVCATLRSAGFSNPVIIMTAYNQVSNEIDAYQNGISAYLVKPFSFSVLEALIENKLKIDTLKITKEQYIIGDVEFYPQTNMIVKNGAKMQLTKVENRILIYLANHMNTVVSRNKLTSLIWDKNSLEAEFSLGMHITRLRRKLESNPKNPEILFTLRGRGMLLRDKIKSMYKLVMN